MANVLEVQVRATVAQAQAALSDFAKSARASMEGLAGSAKSAASALGPLATTGLAVGAAMAVTEKGIDALKDVTIGAAEAVVNMTAEWVKAGGALNDMSVETRLSTKFLQEAKYAGEQVGASQEQIAAAALRASRMIAEGGAKTQAAIAGMGLSLSQLRGQQPEEQFQAIVRGLQGIREPGAQAAASVALFGRSTAVLKLVRSDFQQLQSDAHTFGAVMSEEAIQAADATGDAAASLSAAWDGVKNAIGDLIVRGTPLEEHLHTLALLVGSLSGAANENASTMPQVAAGFSLAADSMGLFLAPMGPMVDGLQQLNAALKITGSLLEGMPVPKAGQFGNPDQINFGAMEAAGIKEAEQQLKEYERAQKEAAAEAKRAQKEAADAAKRHADEIKKLADRYSGLKAQSDMTKLEEAFQSVGGWAGIAKEQVAAFQAELDKAVKGGAKLNEALFGVDTLKVGEAGKKIGSTLVNFAGNQIRHDMSIEANTMWVMAEAAAAKSGLTAGQEFSKMVGTSFVNLGQQIGSTFHSTFGQILGEGVSLFGKLAELGKIKLGEAAKNIAGALSAALGAFMAGFGAGKSKGAVAGAGIGALGGAAAGAAAGSVIPGIGTVLGAVGGGIIGAIGGLFGGKAHDKQVAADLADLRKQLLATYGDMEHLRKVASLLGIDMSKAFTTKNPAELKQMMEQLGAAVEEQKKRLEGLSTAAGGFNGMAEAWGKALAAGGATDAAQAGFNRLGTYASAIFAGIVRETGDVIGALRQIGPGLDQMIQGQQQFGLVASATTANILGLYSVVSNNEDAANSLTYLNQLMTGLNEAGMHSQSLFTAFGQDASQVFADLTAGGATGEQALALMQPTLQQLWEMQRDYGYEVDATTQALLDQAEQQGLVGDNMRSVNEKILEVLLGIAEVFKADIPEGLRRTNSAWGDLNHTASQTPWPNANAGEGGVPHGSAGGNGGGEHYAVGGTVPYTPGGRHVTVSEMETEHIMTSRQLDAIVSRAIGSAMRSGGGRMPPIHVESIVKIDNATLGKAMVRNSRAGNWRIHKSAVGNWR